MPPTFHRVELTEEERVQLPEIEAIEAEARDLERRLWELVPRVAATMGGAVAPHVARAARRVARVARIAGIHLRPENR